MERARPSRSSIPTFVRSKGRVHSPSQDKNNGSGGYHSPARGDRGDGSGGGGGGGGSFHQSSSRHEYAVPHSPSRKEKGSGNQGRHSSPRPQRYAGHHHQATNGHTEFREDRSLCSRSRGTPERGRSSEGSGSARNGHHVAMSSTAQHHQVPKHRSSSGGRYHANVAQVKRNDMCSRAFQEEPLERSVIGCESAPETTDPVFSENAANPTSDFDDQSNGQTGGVKADHYGFTAMQGVSHVPGTDTADNFIDSETNRKVGIISGYSLDDNIVDECQNGAHPEEDVFEDDTLKQALPQGDSGVQNEMALTQNQQGNCVQARQGGPCRSSQVSKDAPAHVSSGVDYPIRGTMSPLTNKVAVKRSIGPVDEVSFVFGRPASPMMSGEQVMRCSSPQMKNLGLARCMSPSTGRYVSGYSSRPMSPSSDVLPVRRALSSGGQPDRRVMSPPPVLGVGTAAEARIHQHGGICCEHCNSCLVELKRQALRLMFPENGSGLAQSIRLDNIGERLVLPELYERWYSRTGQCSVCETPVSQLRQEAVAMVQSIQLAQSTAMPTNIPALVGSCGLMQQRRNRYANRAGKPPPGPYTSSSSSSLSSVPIAAQAQAYLEQNVRAFMNPKKYSQMIAGRGPGSSPNDVIYDTPTSPAPLSDVSETASSSSSTPSSGGHHYQHIGNSSSGSSSHQHHLNHHHLLQQQQQQQQQQQYHHQQWPGQAQPMSGGPLIHYQQHQHVPLRSLSSPSPVSSPTSPIPVPSAAVSFFAR
ncbi:uncharacterized protein LOC101851541 [Aplysia californica]|uniref:Uncharacterized protein LOC101851541 n=1 Tax=Aplysia californica TaxID=6500 RepID=A0ABM1VNV8_APLCA|nr:uncharacterized protein LOC101851541 [Aplysia californica]